MTRPLALITAGFSLAMLTLAALTVFGARWVRRMLP